MQIKAQDIEQVLANNDKTLYLIHGGDLLLTLESVEAIQAKLNTLGYTITEIFDSIRGERIWEELLTSRDNLDLFASQKIIELRLVNVKFGRDGAKILLDFITNLPENIALIVVTDKITSKELNAKWATAINNAGVVVNATTIAKYNLIAWINNRVNVENIQISANAVNILAQHFEGNLLALSQAITKIKLYFNQQNQDVIKVSDIELKDFIINAAKFNIFDLTNALIEANTTRVFQILNNLKKDNIEPTLVLWAITREVKNLTKIIHQINTKNIQIELACKQIGIWQSQITSFKHTINRLNKTLLKKILEQLSILDSINKNIISGNFWDCLQSFCLTFLGINSLNLEEASL